MQIIVKEECLKIDITTLKNKQKYVSETLMCKYITIARSRENNSLIWYKNCMKKSKVRGCHGYGLMHFL